MAGNTLIGVLGVVVAAAGWGSNYVVVKGYDMKDGFAFQLWLCLGIFLVGLISAFMGQQVPGYAFGEGGLGAVDVRLSLLGVLGGSFWCVGNLCTVQIISDIGLGIGLPLWAGTHLLMSFTVGQMHVCIAGECLEPAPLRNFAFGAVGCFASMLALVLLANVKTNVDSTRKKANDAGDIEDVVAGISPQSVDSQSTPDPTSPHSKPSQMSISSQPSLRSISSRPSLRSIASTVSITVKNLWTARFRGTSMALLAGLLYGLMFLPGTIYGQHHNQESTVIGEVRFFFSQYVGIFLTSVVAYSVYFIVHAASGSPLPQVPMEAMLPAVSSGVLWGIAGAGSMISIAELGLSVGSVLCLNGALLVNSMWAVFYFHEVRGQRSLTIFGVAAFSIIAASALISLSK